MVFQNDLMSSSKLKEICTSRFVFDVCASGLSRKEISVFSSKICFHFLNINFYLISV